MLQKSLFSKIVAIALTLVIAFGSVSPALAQAANPPSVASYEKLPEKGQLIVPAGKGWVAPDAWNGLNVTIWYGVTADTVLTMANLGNGIAEDRVRDYGGTLTDYPTVQWSGTSVKITGNNCRPEFYSDSTVLTGGVVYGDQCPLLIEYNAEGHFVTTSTNSLPDSVSSYDSAYAKEVCGNREVDSFDPVSGKVECQRASILNLGSMISWIPWALIAFLVILLLIGSFTLFRRPATAEASASTVRPSRKTDKPVKKTTKK